MAWKGRSMVALSLVHTMLFIGSLALYVPQKGEIKNDKTPV